MTVSRRQNLSSMVGEPNILIDPDLSVRREYTSNAETLYHGPRRRAGQYDLSSQTLSLLPREWVGRDFRGDVLPLPPAEEILPYQLVLELLAGVDHGLTSKEIAHRLGVGKHTIHAAIRRLRLRKMIVRAGMNGHSQLWKVAR